MSNQRMMPDICSRCGALAAIITWPPTSAFFSNSTTSWPRSFATRAASRPAGPAPTTTTLRFGPRELLDDVRHGRPCIARGGRVLDAQHVQALVLAVDAVVRADALLDLVLAAVADLDHHVRVGDLRARHADQVDHAAFASRRSAWPASRMLCACITGIFTTDLMPAARCTNGSGGSAIGGMQLARVLWVSPPEPTTPR